MSGKAKKFVVSDESVNTYGTRLLSSGARLDNFKKNPVMFYNHRTYALPIGRWEDLKLEGGKLVATPVFDENDDFAQQIKAKVENGYLSAASVGLRVISTSDDPSVVIPGQRRATITEWALREISIVNLPANKNAIAFYDENGEQLELSDEGDCPIELLQADVILSESKNNNNTSMEINLKDVANELGLSAANDTEVLSAVRNLKKDFADAKVKLSELEKKEADRKAEEIENILSEAEDAEKITKEQRAHFKSFLEKDFDGAKAVIESMQPALKLSDVAGEGSSDKDGKFLYKGMTFSELSKKDSKALLELKEKDFATFNRLYDSEYGKPYKK